MEDKKFCRNCGEELTKESLFCQKCGASTNSLNNKPENKTNSKTRIAIPVAILIMVIVVSAYVLLPRYEIDEYNELIEKVNNEIALANSDIDEYDSSIEYVTQEWENLSWNTQNIYSLQQTVTKMKDYHTTLTNNTELLSTANQHYSNVILYYKDIKELYLPDWYYQYVDLKIKAIEKRQEGIKTRDSADNKRKDMRNATIGILEGAIDGYVALDELSNLERYASSNNYIAAEQSLIKSAQYLDTSINKWKQSYKIVPLISLKGGIDALECINSSIGYFIQAINYEKKGNYYQSEQLSNMAFDKLQKCQQINSYQNIELELDLWFTRNIDPLVREEERLFNEAISFDNQANELWNNNN